MPRPLTLNGNTYQYPEAGDDPNWGQDASDLMADVVDSLNNLVGSGDILESTFSISNNISVATDITGLLFDTGTTRTADISYNVYRVSTSTQSGYSESGKIIATYDNNATAGSKWLLSCQGGLAGLVLTITDAGQMQYMSNDIGSPGYTGLITFSAKILSQ